MARRFRRLTRFGTGAVATSLAVAGLALTTPTAAAQDWSACLQGPDDTQAVFARAAKVSGVPEDVLLAVGYLGSRWSQNAGQPSVSGGYGVMHLTDQPVAATSAPEKGDSDKGLPDRAGTMTVASEATDLSLQRLRTDPVANICGASAVLASYQPGTTAQRPAAWSTAIALYAGTTDRSEALHYARLAFDVLRTGATETTDLGDTVTLAAHPHAALDAAAVQDDRLLQPGVQEVECPATIDCGVVEATYNQYGTSPTQYANYDLADREKDLSVDYLVVHNTECEYDDCMALIQHPTRFVSWHYTVRSVDGHVDQHVATRNVAAHAGNWYLNMHSVGVEHEGKAGYPGQWYTEALYRSSSELVKHLAAKYGYELDRAHVVGHEEFGSSNYKWDPGPYWDWEHYMTLLGAPIQADGPSASQVVTVKPGFTDNQRALQGCFASTADPDGQPCPSFGTNYVDVRTEPRDDAPLEHGSTDQVSDRNARAAAGHKFYVVKREGDWLKVAWDGSPAWIKSPLADPSVVPSHGDTVAAVGGPATVYQRAYPEQAAYVGTPVPYQGQPALLAPDGKHTVKLQPGQQYVVADKTVPTDYYYAKSFDNSIPGDKTVITGRQKYYQVWVGHRFGYVKAEDVQVLPGR